MLLRQWIKSANFAIEGILHAARTQRHLRYHLYVAACVILGSYAIGVTRDEFLIISLAVIVVMVAEMLNTAVEAIVDLISPEHHPQAKVAKDVAAGGVLITAFGAAVIGYIILTPHIMNIFYQGVGVIERPAEEISVLAFILVLIAVVLLKAYTGKGSPLSGGFPSGHAALAFSVLVSVIFSTHSYIASGLCLVLALFIAQGRVTCKVHTTSEVVVGAALGALITLALFMVFS
jgi:diacylglycerol kinase (ATP)